MPNCSYSAETQEILGNSFDAWEISWEPRDVPRAKAEGHFKGWGKSGGEEGGHTTDHLGSNSLWIICAVFMRSLVLPLVSLILIVINVIIVASRSSSFIYIWRFTSFTKNTSFTKLSVRCIQMYSIYIYYIHINSKDFKSWGDVQWSTRSPPHLVFCGKWKLYFILVMNLVSILGQTISSHL